MDKTPGQVAREVYFGGGSSDAWDSVAAAVIAHVRPQIEQDVEGEFKDAVIDKLIVNYIYTKAHDSAPKEALNDLLAFALKMALDPKMSSEAAQLVAEARAKVVEDVIAISKNGGRYLFPDGVPEDILKINEDSYKTIRALAPLPSGHCVVPVEPTEAMLMAAYDCVWPQENSAGVIPERESNECAAAIYKAMIAGKV